MWILYLLGFLFCAASIAAQTIYSDNPPIGLDSTSQQVIVGTLMISLFLGMVFEILTPEILFMTALIIVMLFQIITIQETLSGFSNQSMITIGTLYLVVGGIERSHIVDYIARKTFGTEGSILAGKFRMMATCFCLSIFFNNTPLVAILLPVVKDWARMRNIAASQMLIPLSYSVLAGSFVTMIGTSTNLTVQGLMEADRGYSFDFFAPAPFGFAAIGLLIAYQLIAGPYLLPNAKSGLIRTVKDKASSLMAEIFVSDDSPAVGKSLGSMMGSLGIAPSSVIKIRRGLDQLPHVESDKTVDPSAEMQDKHFNKSRGESLRPGNDHSHVKSAVGDEEGQQLKEFLDIIAPSHHELVRAGDVVFVSSAQDVVAKMMKSIAGESKGLFILTSDVLALPGFGTELVECVVSDSNPFLGMKVSEMASSFGTRYSAGLITVRGKDWEAVTPAAVQESEPEAEGVAMLKQKQLVPTEDEGRDKALSDEDENKSGSGGSEKDDRLNRLSDTHTSTVEKISVSDHRLAYGDILLCVTHERELPALETNKDFFVVSTVGALPKPLDLYKLVPVLIFAVMLALVASEQIRMAPAALTVTVVFFLGGWVTAKDISTMVDLRLLMLIGCAISFAQAVTRSGLAETIANTLAQAATTPQSALFLVYALTLGTTELISNNAAAALMYPIAVNLADNIGVSYKPFAMAVLVASSAGFMSPIGYQTHVMVWAPGGYKYTDFLRFGLVPDIMYWLVAGALIPVVYPFNP